MEVTLVALFDYFWQEQDRDSVSLLTLHDLPVAFDAIDNGILLERFGS